jgi:hypothetical protein
MPNPLTHHGDESLPPTCRLAPCWLDEDLLLRLGQRLAALVSLRNAVDQSQDEKQFHKGNKEVQLTDELSAGHRVSGPSVGCLPMKVLCLVLVISDNA